MKKIQLTIVGIFLSLNLFAQGPKVLIIGAAPQSYIDDVKTQLDATSSFSSVTIINSASSTPSLSTMQSYDIILNFQDGCAQNTTSLYDNLASYVNAGGALVNSTFALVSYCGSFSNFTSLMLMSGTGQTGGNATLGTVLLSSHPIMSGISTFNGGSSSYRQTGISMASGSYTIAQWSDGLPLIVAKDAVGAANVRRVDLNFYPPSTGARSDFWVSSTDGTKIIKNALLWVFCNTTAITSISVTPSSEVTTGGINTNLYIGYPTNSPSATLTANGSSTVTWTPGTNLSCSTCVSPVFTPTTAGTYTFTASNCKGSKVVTFCVKDIRVPNTSGSKAAVYMCHLEPGKTTPKTEAVLLRGIPSHFQYHKGDKLGYCGNTCATGKRDFDYDNLVVDEQYLEVLCTPNPFRQSFKLHYISNSPEDAIISIYGMTGNLVEKVNLAGVADEAQFGTNLPNGIYTVSFIQGDKNRVFRMIKVD